MLANDVRKVVVNCARTYILLSLTHKMAFLHGKVVVFPLYFWENDHFTWQNGTFTWQKCVKSGKSVPDSPFSYLYLQNLVNKYLSVNSLIRLDASARFNFFGGVAGSEDFACATLPPPLIFKAV